jgi:hypothetical protein
MKHFDLREYRRTGTWRGILLPEELNQRIYQANLSVALLTSRVRDDRVRELAAVMTREANRVPFSSNERGADDALIKMSKALNSFHERMGEVLRKLDDEKDASAP